MLATRRSATRVLIGACILALSGTASAISKSELEQRIVQLERRLESRGLMEMLNSVETLQKDMQQLRGEIEVQTHSVEALKKRQRELYLDIDRRLHRLETAGVPATSGSALIGGGAAPITVTTIATTPAVPNSSGMVKTAPAPLDPAAERKEYDKALAILRDGRYPAAAKAFSSFLGMYPQSSYTDNAQYWLGEVYYVTRKFELAQLEFGKVISDHPKSPKVADAKLKTGYIHYENKQWQQARSLLTGITQSYTQTTAARLAQERLDRMTREGH